MRIALLPILPFLLDAVSAQLAVNTSIAAMEPVPIDPPPGQPHAVELIPLDGRISPVLSGSFVGLSLEWTHVDDAIGMGVGASSTGNLGTAPIVAGLMATLRNSSGGWPVHVRIGGNSATKLWWQGSQLPRLAQSLWAVVPAELQILQQFCITTLSKLTLNVPMLSPDPAYAIEFLTQGVLVNIAASNIFAIEIGNEPDHYEKNDRRPPGYTFDMFNAEYTKAHAAIVAAIGPSFQYQGPAYAYPWTESELVPFLQSQNATKYISFHKYGQQGCSTATNPNAVTPLTLMMDPAPDEYAWLQPMGDVAAGRNQTLVWGEGGSSSCNGTMGVSDTYVSALWTIDMLLEMAYRGVQYSSISGAGQTNYAPYAIDDALGRITVRPTFYGMIMTSRILRGDGSRIFRAPIDSGWAQVGNATKTWGVFHADGTASLVVIVKTPGAFSVKLGGKIPNVACPGNARPRGFVSRMVVGTTTEPLSATTGITVNGQTWDGSLDGLPVGAYVEEALDPATGVLQVPGYSAAVLRIGCQAGLASVQHVPPPAATIIPPPIPPPGATPAPPGVWSGNDTTGVVPTGTPMNAGAGVSTPRVGALVGIGIAAAVFLLGGGLFIVGLYSRRHKRVPPAGTHPHPFAEGSPYLGKRGGEIV
ncbi:hypothetical protein HDU86_006976 [Geranomyces michiganensis]|nr:hypothetical protein HDU86_006976 [Geranomyces michiganensis]